MDFPCPVKSPSSSSSWYSPPSPLSCSYHSEGLLKLHSEFSLILESWAQRKKTAAADDEPGEHACSMKKHLRPLIFKNSESMGFEDVHALPLSISPDIPLGLIN